MPGSLECGFLVLTSTQTSLLLSGCSAECRHCCLLCQVNKLCWWHFLYTDFSTYWSLSHLWLVITHPSNKTSFLCVFQFNSYLWLILPIWYASTPASFSWQDSPLSSSLWPLVFLSEIFTAVLLEDKTIWQTKMVVVFNEGAGTQCDTEHSLARIHQWHATVLYSLIR